MEKKLVCFLGMERTSTHPSSRWGERCEGDDDETFEAIKSLTLHVFLLSVQPQEQVQGKIYFWCNGIIDLLT